MRRNRALWWSIVSLVAGIATSIALVAVVTHPEPRPPAAAQRSELPHVEQGTEPAAAGPRRMPVAGAPGYWVVVNTDGSSYLEGPDGQRTALAAAGPSVPEQRVADAIAKRLAKTPEKRKGLGQLVVCDSGVVDVPKDAIITFVGVDKVVTLDPNDGSSTAHYVDGRVQRRERVER